jgi:PAS domain S-box-containing protein
VAPRELRLMNGRIIQYQCIALPDGGRMLTYFDITDLKRTEDALRVHLAAMEAAKDGMAILDGETYSYLNAAHLEIYGYGDPAELDGRSWRELYDPDEVARLVDEVIPIVRREGHWNGEAVGRRRDGTTFPQDVSLTLMDGGRLICVVRDITERHARDEALREAKLLAEEASRAKSRFLANISHEVRTPLNAVLGFTELMLDGIYGPLPERAEGVLERVQFNGRHLLALINDILDLSKIEAGEFSTASERFSVRALVQSAAAATEARARAKGIVLTCEIAERLPNAVGDERRLTQVLMNLIGNAIKFTDEGFVQVTARCEGGRLKIAVADSGIGIAPADQARIFDTFQQGGNALASKHGGTGLGLAISKRIVEMHGGTIDVTSEAGRGSTFVIDLPFARALATEAA